MQSYFLSVAILAQAVQHPLRHDAGAYSRTEMSGAAANTAADLAARRAQLLAAAQLEASLAPNTLGADPVAYLAARAARIEAFKVNLAKLEDEFGYGKSSGGGSVHNEDRSPYGDKGMGKSNMDKNMDKDMGKGNGDKDMSKDMSKDTGKDMSKGKGDKDMGKGSDKGKDMGKGYKDLGKSGKDLSKGTVKQSWWKSCARRSATRLP